MLRLAFLTFAGLAAAQTDKSPDEWPAAFAPLKAMGMASCAAGVPMAAGMGVTCDKDLGTTAAAALAPGISGSLCDLCPATCGDVCPAPAAAEPEPEAEPACTGKDCCTMGDKAAYDAADGGRRRLLGDHQPPGVSDKCASCVMQVSAKHAGRRLLEAHEAKDEDKMVMQSMITDCMLGVDKIPEGKCNTANVEAMQPTMGGDDEDATMEALTEMMLSAPECAACIMVNSDDGDRRTEHGGMPPFMKCMDEDAKAMMQTMMSGPEPEGSGHDGHAHGSGSGDKHDEHDGHAHGSGSGSGDSKPETPANAGDTSRASGDSKPETPANAGNTSRASDDSADTTTAAAPAAPPNQIAGAASLSASSVLAALCFAAAAFFV